MVLPFIEPPTPVQVIAYGVVTEGETVALPEEVPPVAKPPAAIQLAAFVLLQVRVEDWPRMMVRGLAMREAVGGGSAQVAFDCVTVPFEHESVTLPTLPFVLETVAWEPLEMVL